MRLAGSAVGLPLPRSLSIRHTYLHGANVRLRNHFCHASTFVISDADKKRIRPSYRHYPNPLSTPKTTSIHQAPFQTPRADPPSHFTDAFYTPQQDAPARTSQLEVTVVRVPTKNVPLTPDDPKFHVNYFQHSQSLPLPPVDPSSCLPSSPNPQASSNDVQRSLATLAPKTETAPMDQFQMQTPPPTRDSTSRQQYVYGQPVVQDTLASGFQGPASTPPAPLMAPHMQTPTFQNPTFHTPMQYPHLQFSPEMFQNLQTGPMSAPAMPNVRFSWDISPQPNSFQSGGVMDAQPNLFGPANPISPPVPSWPSGNPSPAVDPNIVAQPHAHPFERPAQDFWMAETANPQHAMSFSSDPLFNSPAAVVNPTLLFGFSSPQQAPEVSPSHHQVQQPDVDMMSRQPYEHQTRESNWEKELAKRSKQQHNRTTTTSSSFSGSARPALHRSNTDSGFRKVQNRSLESRSVAQALENAARKPSPLKRLSQASLTSIPEGIRPRPRTRLVIDESGRARTETDPIDAEPANEPKSLWDDDDSDEEDLAIPSQRNSFVYPSENVRSTKHARNDSDEQNFNVSKRPLSSASLASITSRLEATPLGKKSARDSMDSNYRRFSMGSFGGSQAGEGSNDGDIFSEEPSSDAQSALKSMVEQRARKKGIFPPLDRPCCGDLTQRAEQTDPQATLRAHNQRWSQASLDVAKFNSQQIPASATAETGFESHSTGPSSASSNTSPSGPSQSYAEQQEVLTPSTDQSSRSNESTRCVCSNNSAEADNAAMMIQCESCMKWLHVKCLGLNSQALPPVYVCVFCTGTTPLARGGRIRMPNRLTNVLASPLSYKSNPFKR